MVSHTGDSKGGLWIRMSHQLEGGPKTWEITFRSDSINLTILSIGKTISFNNYALPIHNVIMFKFLSHSRDFMFLVSQC